MLILSSEKTLSTDFNFLIFVRVKLTQAMFTHIDCCLITAKSPKLCADLKPGHGGRAYLGLITQSHNNRAVHDVNYKN